MNIVPRRPKALFIGAVSPVQRQWENVPGKTS